MSPSARLTLPPGHHTGPTWRRRSIRRGNVPGPPSCHRPSNAHGTKALGPRPPSPVHSPWPATPTSRRAFGSGLPASWWLTLTLVRPPRGRSQGAWCPKAGDWRHTNPNARLTLKPGHQTGPPGATAHSGRENVPGPPSHHRHSNSPRAKTHGPTLPIPSALTLASPSVHRTAFGSCLPASWGLTLTLGQPPCVPSQGAWHHNAGDWEHTNPNARLTLSPGHQTGQRGTAAHSGRENGQCPPSHHRSSNAPCSKTLGPMLPYAAPSPRPTSPLTTQPLARACRPPGA